MSQSKKTLVIILTLQLIIGLISAITLGYLERLRTNSSTPPQQVQAVASSVEVQNAPSGLFSYGGSTTWAPIRKEVDPIIQNVYPNFQLRYVAPAIGAPGSSSGIKMLLNNQLAFVQSSRPLKEEEYQQARQKGFSLREIPVAIDGIAVATHLELQIPGLTVGQLQDIYTGKITNWNQVGGPNLSITPYSRNLEESGTVEFFVENVLEGENFGKNVEFVPTTTQALRKVAENPGSIYYASAPEIIPQCKVKSLPIGREADELVAPYQEPFVSLAQCPTQRNQINQSAFQSGEYPLTRQLFVIVKENGQEDEQAGFAYANSLRTNIGQDLIAEAGFIPIR